MTPRRGAALCAAAGTVLGALAAAHAAGLNVNVTPSMPIGLWRVTPAGRTLEKGDIVSVCLPDGDALRLALQRGYTAAGSCPGGAEPLIKPIAAIGGDSVVISETGISVNGAVVPNTAPLTADEAGRPLGPTPPGSYHVARGELWLLSGHDRRSFDSRYFGPVSIANVQGIARPLWVLR